MIQFSSENHSYTSIESDSRKWQSVTTVLSKFKGEFPREERLQKCSTRKPTATYPNKWYSHPVEVIAKAWDDESLRSTELGTWYHNKREQELYNGPYHNVYSPVYIEGVKIAPDQRLQPGIYPEHMVYLESIGLCGQVDRVNVLDTSFDISDYKTGKEIKKRGFKNWEGIYKKMQKPLQHLEECELNSYALQMSLYAYMISRYNPYLSVGNLTIEHVKFVEESKDQWDYPIYKREENGDYIVKDIEYISVPYMQKEVKLIVDKLKAEQDGRL